MARKILVKFKIDSIAFAPGRRNAAEAVMVAWLRRLRAASSPSADLWARQRAACGRLGSRAAGHFTAGRAALELRASSRELTRMSITLEQLNSLRKPQVSEVLNQTLVTR